MVVVLVSRLLIADPLVASDGLRGRVRLALKSTPTRLHCQLFLKGLGIIVLICIIGLRGFLGGMWLLRRMLATFNVVIAATRLAIRRNVGCQRARRLRDSLPYEEMTAHSYSSSIPVNYLR